MKIPFELQITQIFIKQMPATATGKTLPIGLRLGQSSNSETACVFLDELQGIYGLSSPAKMGIP